MSCPRCSKQVLPPQMWFHTHQCTRRGVVQREGKWYCKQHDPEKEKAKRDAQQVEWKAERDESNKNEADADKLIKRLGFGGSPYFGRRSYPDKSGYRRAIVLTFDEVERIITALRAGQLMFEQIEKEKA